MRSDKAIVMVGFGGPFDLGIARMQRSLYKLDIRIPVVAWINTLPPGTPDRKADDPISVSGYLSKPFALLGAAEKGYTYLLWVDAAYWAICSLHRMWQHLREWGYFLVDDGFNLGEWSSDASLARFGVDREAAMHTPNISASCIGLDLSRPFCREFLKMWSEAAADGKSFHGFHGNSVGGWPGRSVGFVSKDPRVKGHRHDQPSAGMIAYHLGMTHFVPRPKLTALFGTQTEETVLVTEGGFHWKVD